MGLSRNNGQRKAIKNVVCYVFSVSTRFHAIKWDDPLFLFPMSLCSCTFHQNSKYLFKCQRKINGVSTHMWNWTIYILKIRESNSHPYRGRVFWEGDYYWAEYPRWVSVSSTDKVSCRRVKDLDLNLVYTKN